MSGSNFVDYVKIFCRSGKGGAGSSHLRREKYIPKGGPDGGDGGRGGNVILRGNKQMWTLLHLKYRKHIFAGHGMSGSSGMKSGSEGDDVVIDVEIGEVVINPMFLKRVSIKAVNEINYICDYDNSPKYIDLEIENIGNVRIEAGTEITYTLDYLNKGVSVNEIVILPFDLFPNEKFKFSSAKSFIFTDLESTIQLSIFGDNSSSKSNLVSVSFIQIINEIIFNNAVNNTIETNELPSYIYAEFNTSFDSEDNKITYKWDDGTYGLDRIAYNEGIYTLTVKTEYCISTRSVELKQINPNQDYDQNYGIYPNPSHGQITITNDNTITNVNVDVYDPWASKEEVKHEYNFDLLDDASNLRSNYDAIVLAVSHNEFLELDLQKMKSDIGVIFDVKSLLPRHKVDARL
jgi:hypothetical protein